MKQTTVIIDVSSLAYPALYTTGHLSYNGNHTGIKYGFFKRLIDYAEKFKTNDFIFCCDDKHSFRRDIYPEYKAQRIKKKNDKKSELEIEQRNSYLRQIEDLKVVIPQLGFCNIFQQKGFEADDLIAYWVQKLKGENIILITTDTDMYQCLDNCCIWQPFLKKIVDSKYFKNRYNIEVKDWARAKAIGGCSTDEVEGIAGASDPKNPESKALSYIRGELKKGLVLDRIKSKEGKAIIKRNLKLVSLPYQEKRLKRMFKRKNQFDRKSFIRIFDTNRFISFLDYKEFKRWEIAFGIGLKK